ncbi:hypothetical protein BH23GEM10_BH23GEM10_18220 [soil metagenome]
MTRTLMLAAAAVAALPALLHAQSPGIAMRAGTLGIGVEAGIGVISRFGVRAGYSVMPIRYETSYSGHQYTVQPTSPLKNIGIDYYPGIGDLRIGAGMLFISGPTELEGRFAGAFEIGGEPFIGDARVRGEFDHGSSAPYVIMGFGHPTGGGMNLFLDLGLGYLGKPDLSLTASGTATQDPRFQGALERERQQAERDANEYFQLLPIFSFGFRYGF